MPRLVRFALAMSLAVCRSRRFRAGAGRSKPVRLIIPLAAGGNLDIVTRSIAQKLTEVYGQQVIVENRPG